MDNNPPPIRKGARHFLIRTLHAWFDLTAEERKLILTAIFLALLGLIVRYWQLVQT